MITSESKKEREEKLLCELQKSTLELQKSPRDKAEDFVKTVLLPHFKSSQCIADGKRHYHSCYFFHGSDYKGFSYDTIKEAVSIVAEVEKYGIKGRVGKDSCSFYKESEDAESV